MNKEQQELINKYIEKLKIRISERVSGDLRKMLLVQIQGSMVDLEASFKEKK